METDGRTRMRFKRAFDALALDIMLALLGQPRGLVAPRVLLPQLHLALFGHPALVRVALLHPLLLRAALLDRTLVLRLLPALACFTLLGLLDPLRLALRLRALGALEVARRLAPFGALRLGALGALEIALGLRPLLRALRPGGIALRLRALAGDLLRTRLLALLLARLALVVVIVLLLLREHGRGAAGCQEDAQHSSREAVGGANTAHVDSPAWAQPDRRPLAAVSGPHDESPLTFSAFPARS